MAKAVNRDVLSRNTMNGLFPRRSVPGLSLDCALQILKHSQIRLLQTAGMRKQTVSQQECDGFFRSSAILISLELGDTVFVEPSCRIQFGEPMG